jgi:hypothetical protein
MFTGDDRGDFDIRGARLVVEQVLSLGALTLYPALSNSVLKGARKGDICCATLPAVQVLLDRVVLQKAVRRDMYCVPAGSSTNSFASFTLFCGAASAGLASSCAMAGTPASQQASTPIINRWIIGAPAARFCLCSQSHSVMAGRLQS